MSTTKLDKQQKFTIRNAQWDLPAFHGLPKLHKAGILKLRPIVGVTSWVTTNPSKLLSHILHQELAKSRHIDTILRDSKELANQLDTLQLPDNCILFTMDATSLYTNMSPDLVITTLNEFISDSPSCYLPGVAPLPAQFVLEIVINYSK
jgi:hypothetical protein